MTEAYTSLENTVRYYGNTTEPMAQIPFNFQLLTNLNFSSNANNFKSIIDTWMKAMPAGQWANWVVSISACGNGKTKIQVPLRSRECRK